MTAKMRNSKDYPVEHGPRRGETIIFLHGGFVAIELIRRHPPNAHMHDQWFAATGVHPMGAGVPPTPIRGGGLKTKA